MLIFETVAEAELPATSVQLPLTDCPANSVVNTVFAGGLPGADLKGCPNKKSLRSRWCCSSRFGWEPLCGSR